MLSTTYLHSHLRQSLETAGQPSSPTRYPRRCAPISALEQIKDMDPLQAQAIRLRWKDTGNSVSYCRKVIDELAGTCGVEFLGYHKRTGLAVHYCNGGDPYATTIIFHGLNLQVGCWGDLIERNQIDHREDY